MNIFKHKWFWGVVVIFVILCIFIISGIERTQTSAEHYDLKPEQLIILKKDVLEKRDARAAWRVSAYYGCTKKDYVEMKKWEKIAREIESAINTNVNPVRSNNPSDGK